LMLHGATSGQYLEPKREIACLRCLASPLLRRRLVSQHRSHCEFDGLRDRPLIQLVPNDRRAVHPEFFGELDLGETKLEPLSSKLTTGQDRNVTCCNSPAASNLGPGRTLLTAGRIGP